MAYNLTHEKKTLAVSMLCEGMSIRGIERATSIHRDTIMRLGVRMGEGCRKIMDEKFRNLPCRVLQLDECWGWVGMKQRTAIKLGIVSENAGDAWLWVALDADTKLVPSFVVGDRSQATADAFIEDLASRMSHQCQITTDGLTVYRGAIERAFGSDADVGSLVKTFSSTDIEQERRYSPPRVVHVARHVVSGEPDEDLISTSYVEKQHHTTRMHVRRLARLTNAFSRKLANLRAAVSLHYAYYNLVKTHCTLRCAPAVEAGVIKSAWSVSDLVEMIEG